MRSVLAVLMIMVSSLCGAACSDDAGEDTGGGASGSGATSGGASGGGATGGAGTSPDGHIPCLGCAPGTGLEDGEYAPDSACVTSGSHPDAKSPMVVVIDRGHLLSVDGMPCTFAAWEDDTLYYDCGSCRFRAIIRYGDSGIGVFGCSELGYCGSYEIEKSAAPGSGCADCRQACAGVPGCSCESEC